MKVKFICSDKYKKSFQELKDRWTLSPVLALLNGFDGFMVYCYVSRFVLDGVLVKNGKIIAYASKQPKDQTKNYLTHDLELTIIMFA